MTRRVSWMIVCAVASGACGGQSDASDPASVTSPRADHACGLLWEVQWRLGPRVRGATPDALDLSRYALQPDGTFASPAGTTCSDEMAARLTTLCATCQERPGDCEPLVRALFSNVPAACSRCGDDVCYQGESADGCPPDCGLTCGDGYCSAREAALTCPIDCAIACGDGQCAGGEDATVCPIDCRYAVGDGVCAPGETPDNSPQDCGYATCGDGFCQTYEGALLCPEDCCWPRVCDVDYRRCRDAGALETCVASGSAACPERVESEPCEHGCVDAPAGDARCRTCAEALADALPSHQGECRPGGAPTCGGDHLRRCVPLFGSATCGYVVTEACGGPCVGGACAGSCDGCALAWTECVGDRVRRCVNVAPGCNQWRDEPTPCADGCVGAEHHGHCATCLDLGCPEGEACVWGECARCEPALCVASTRRCATTGDGAAAIEQCVTDAGCSAWIRVQTCAPEATCLLDPEGNPACGGG